VNYVYLQPLQMARWLRENTPEDALIAVHDVGMMRYMGGRNTLDMVGLTTPGAAAYWRNGPGSIAEFLIQERPDYIAAYGKGHGLGLGMIAQTSIYGDPLVAFPVVLDDYFNVALANDYQGIYQLGTTIQGLSPRDVEDYPSDGEFIWQTLYVANLESAAKYNYQWSNQGYVAGFPTEVHELGCIFQWNPPDCNILMSTRRINGEEDFVLESTPSYSMTLITIIHPVDAGAIDLFVNNKFVDRQWIPEMPGQYFIISTPIPSEFTSSDQIHIRISANMEGGYYFPVGHFALESVGDNVYSIEDTPSPEQISAIYQNGSLTVEIAEPIISDEALSLEPVWYSNGRAEGDYRFFIHLYDDTTQPPVAQADTYLIDGTAPPGNLPPGKFDDVVVVDLSDVTPGTYQLAIGFYNPYTGERLIPESEVYEVSPDGRLWLGEVEVPAAN
jgi:hypothetical protein